MALIVFHGRLTRDPEYDHEKQRCKFSVAENKRSEEAAPNYWDCSVKGHQAEFCSQYLCKGRLVKIEGHIDQRKSGEKTYYNVHVDRVEPLDRPREDKKHEDSRASDEYNPFEDSE
jgi:single-stranded DNA-binding protein